MLLLLLLWCFSAVRLLLFVGRLCAAEPACDAGTSGRLLVLLGGRAAGSSRVNLT